MRNSLLAFTAVVEDEGLYYSTFSSALVSANVSDGYHTLMGVDSGVEQLQSEEVSQKSLDPVSKST